jgi:hypothetical protein
MNVPRLPIVVLISACAFLTGLTAQTALNQRPYLASASDLESPLSAPAAYRHHKKLPQTFTGYAIEVATSRYPLQNGEAIFRQFGSVYYQKHREGGYSYLIKVNFSSEDAAWHFIDTVVLPKVPTAKLFQYKEGNRKHLEQ